MGSGEVGFEVFDPTHPDHEHAWTDAIGGGQVCVGCREKQPAPVPRRDEGDVERLAEVVGAHRASMGTTDDRIWEFCRCNPDVELTAHEGRDVPPVGHEFYHRAMADFSAHLAEAVLASPWLADLLAATRAEALASVLALADEWEQAAKKPMPERAKTESAQDQGVRIGVWHSVKTAASELRAALDAPASRPVQRDTTEGGE